MPNMPKLTFSPMADNAKLRKLEKASGLKGYTFSLMSGHSCPFASKCLSSAVPQLGGGWKIVDGKRTEFRCFSASQEVLFTEVRAQRIANMAILEYPAHIAAQYIKAQIPENAELIRPHVGGDFATEEYFRAWLAVITDTPQVRFYFYTKATPFLVKYRDLLDSLPNCSYVASRGGTRDDLIDSHNLREAIVVGTHAQAEEMGLVVDEDDSIACFGTESFALVIHGAQPPQGKYAKEWQAARRAKIESNRLAKGGAR